ncbi:MAG: hypothetical protein ABTQ24_12910 [Azonexus sp.]
MSLVHSAEFSTAGNDSERYEHISRAQIHHLVASGQGNRLAPVPLIKRYGPPTEPFARKYTAGDIFFLVEMDKESS